MKIRTIPTTKLALLCAALIAAWLMFPNKASAVSIRDASHYSDGSTYVRHLLGMGPRHDEISNAQYFSSNISLRHVVLPDHVNADRSIRVITIPGISGVPSPVGRVPDGGITAMLLGTALGALGIARRYIRN